MVTSKLQLTVPKAIADQFGIRPGDHLEWVAAGEAIHVIPGGKSNLREQATHLARQPPGKRAWRSRR